VRYDTPNTDATGRRLASPLHCPIVSYRDLSGAEHSFLSDAGSEQETYAVGDRVTVAYLPHSKGGQEVVSSATCWGARVWLGWALTIVAVVCLIPFVTIAYALLNGRRVRDVVASLKHAQRPSSPPSWSWSRSE
jgi:hypothetical protein